MIARILATMALFGTLYGGEEIPPREIFFKNSEKSAVKISPDGKKISYLAPVEGVMNVWIGDLEGKNSRPVTSAVYRSISDYCWSAEGSAILYVNDNGGDENDHIFSLDLATMESRDLTPLAGSKSAILHISEKRPDQILITNNDRDAALFDVYEVDLFSGKREMVLQNDEGYFNFLADEDLNLRAAVLHSEMGLNFYIKEGKEAPFELLKSYSFSEMPGMRLVTLSKDGKELYFQDAVGRDHTSLKRYRFSDRSIEELFYDSGCDFEYALFDPKTQRPDLFFSYGLRRREHPGKSGFARVWEAAKKAAHGEPISYAFRGSRHPYWILAAQSDRIACRYYLFNEETLSGKFLFSAHPELDRLELRETEAVTITARDGLALPSYLVRPKGAKGPGALVLLVHGGPWVRDNFEYQPYRQWLASRGYSVLAVNYRGSSGLGKKHLNAGDREWSKKIHDDLVDAVNWAVENGIADPNKIAIMGGSFGGYAALVGLTFTPELFAAGVDIVGPSHVKTLLSTFPPYWNHYRNYLFARVAPPDDEAFMDSISPLTYVDRICRPLLILQGQNDPRVKESESRQIVAAMQEKNIPVTYALFPDEGHGFRMEKNRLASIAIIEQFLANHLGGKREPLGDAVQRSSAKLLVGEELIAEVNSSSK